MPKQFVINLIPVNEFTGKPQAFYLRTVGMRDGRTVVDSVSYDLQGALRFWTRDEACRCVATLMHAERAIVEEIDSAPASGSMILLDPATDMYLHAAVACPDGWLRAVGGCRQNAMRFVDLDAAARVLHLISNYPNSCIV